MVISRMKFYRKLSLCSSFSCFLGCLLLAISAQAAVVLGEEQLTCYSSKAGPENCRGDQCQAEICGSEHDACLVREISWENDQREPKVTYSEVQKLSAHKLSQVGKTLSHFFENPFSAYGQKLSQFFSFWSKVKNFPSFQTIIT